MNVKFDKNDAVSGVLTISIQEPDYQQSFKSKLNETGRQHPIKGFRPGHTPAAMLKRLFGEQVLGQVLDKMVSNALTDYIKKENLHILGEPIIDNDVKIDLKNDKNFDFKFELGLTPEIDLKLDKDIKIPYYTIEVTDKMVNDQNNVFKKRYGKEVQGEVSDEDSRLEGKMVELAEDGNEKTDGIKVEKTVVMPRYLKDADEKAKLVGVKTGTQVVFNPSKAVEGDVNELAAMLNLDKDQADVKSDFRFYVDKILVNQEAEMNQELFDNVLGKDVAKNEKEYLAKVKEMIANQLKNDSNYRFTIDAEKVLMDKVGDLQLPDEFLKKFLKINAKSNDENKKEVEDKIENDYPQTRKQIQWQLLKDKIATDLDVKITVEDKTRLARFFAAQQLAQYGFGNNLDDSLIDNVAKRILQDANYSREIENRAFEDKVFAAIKDHVALDEKTVSAEDFNKLFDNEKKEEKK